MAKLAAGTILEIRTAAKQPAAAVTAHANTRPPIICSRVKYADGVTRIERYHFNCGQVVPVSDKASRARRSCHRTAAYTLGVRS